MKALLRGGWGRVGGATRTALRCSMQVSGHVTITYKQLIFHVRAKPQRITALAALMCNEATFIINGRISYKVTLQSKGETAQMYEDGRQTSKSREITPEASVYNGVPPTRTGTSLPGVTVCASVCVSLGK